MLHFRLSCTSLKALTTFSCLVFAFLQNTNAQSPVLTADNSSPHLGDTFVFVSSHANNYDTGHSGINQVWNYSGLTDSLDVFGKLAADTQVCVAPSATPFAANFPNASFATTHTNSPIPYYFYYSNNTGISFIWGNEDVLGNYNIYTKPSGSIPFPVSYGNSYTDSNSYFNQFGMIVNGADSSYADGYGTLMLPGVTISNVLRIKTINSFSTPVILNGDIYVYNVRLEAYYYFAPGYHANILGLHHFINTYSLNGALVNSLTTYSDEIYHASSNSLLVPLQIISFDTYLKGQDVFLQWQTASEQNTSYFNMLRSSDGVHFSTINKIAAAGNSSTIKSYTYTDAGAAQLKMHSLYYRLQEIDKDGKSNYSNIVKIDLPTAHVVFSVSPNPAKDFIHLISSYNVSAAQVIITDMSGKMLFTSKQNFIAAQQLKIPISQFPNEVLIITVVSSNSKEIFKIIKE